MTEEAYNKVMDELQRARAHIAKLETQLKNALLGKVPEHQLQDSNTIWIEPIISHRTKQGLVNLRWGHLSAQMDVAQAREHAHGILQAAEAAETDAFLHQYFTQTLGSTPEMFAQFIRDFRLFREKKR